MGNLRVHLCKSVFVLREVVKRTVVGLSVSVLRAEDVRALAGNLHETDFLGALPALVRIGLHWLKQSV